MWKQAAKTIAKWTVPPGFQQIALAQWAEIRPLDKDRRSVLSLNRVLHNSHVGKRCFILGTGPSINLQDLAPLSHEICISLNSFYLHKDYRSISPSYHLLSGLALHPNIHPEKGVEFFREIEEKVTADIMFHNYLDRNFISHHGLFKTHKVNYLHFASNWDYLMRNGVDATKALYPGSSVSVMAIQMALYMGFDSIYLLGLDHDWILRRLERLSTHFYKPNDSVLERDGSRDWDTTDWEGEFLSHRNLWHQYKLLRRFAENNGVAIYNATAGGLLDVFERVNYDEVVK